MEFLDDVYGYLEEFIETITKSYIKKDTTEFSHKNFNFKIDKYEGYFSVKGDIFKEKINRQFYSNYSGVIWDKDDVCYRIYVDSYNELTDKLKSIIDSI